MKIGEHHSLTERQRPPATLQRSIIFKNSTSRSLMLARSALPQIQLRELDLRPVLGLLSIVRLPAPAIADLIRQTHADPDLAHVCMQMFYILLALDQRAFALDMQANALRQQRLYRLAGSAAPAIRLLALMGPGDMLDNTPYEFLLERSDIRLDLLFVLPGQALPEVIPDHDVLIVALGESTKNQPLLEQLVTDLAHWPRPVLNPPQRVMRCARPTVYQLLHGTPGLLMPATQRLASDQIQHCRFPLTVRPVDTQGGTGLVRFESDTGLGAYFQSYPATAYDVADFVDYRSPDGLFRKLRIVLIHGQAFICHLAIGAHWMVHYRSAGMDQSAAKRAEEAAMMAGFEQDFAVRHQGALKAIAERLGLDYVVLDCAETIDARLLLFEADSRGWIHASDPVDVFPYKPNIMQKAFDAFRGMLLQCAPPSPEI